MADFSLFAQINADSTGFTKAVEQAQQSTSKLSKAFEEVSSSVKNGAKEWGLDLDQFYSKGSGILADFGVDLSKFASKLGVNGVVVAAIATATAALYKFGESANEARANLAKGTGAIGKDLKELTDTLSDTMISGVGRSMDEISNMMADINTRFGSTGEELKDLTSDFDQFADITGTDVRTAIKGVADVTKKWGLTTKEINPLMQQLSMTAKMSGASVNDLMKSMQSGQAIFQQFGMSATQSMAFLGTLAQNGVESTTAIQGLKTALVKFSAEGKNAQQGLAEISEKIKNAKSESEAMSISVETFGSKAGVDMVKVLKDGSLNAEEFANALRNAGGSMEETYEISRNVSSALDDLKSVLTGAFVGMGSGFSDMIRDIIDSITAIAQPIMSTLQPVFDIVGELFAFVGKVIKEFVTNFMKLQEKLSGGFNATREMLLAVRNMVRKVLGNIFDIFKNVFSIIFDIIDGKWALVWERTKLILMKAVDTIFSVISGLANGVKSAINGMLAGINTILSKVGMSEITLIPDLDLSEVTGLSKVIEDTESKIRDMSGESADKIIGDLGVVKDVTVETFATVKDSGETAFGSLKGLTGDWITKLKSQEIALLQEEAKRAEEKAKNENASEEEIYQIRLSYNEKLKPLLIEQVELQRKAELEKVAVARESAEKIVAESAKLGTKLTAKQKEEVAEAKKLITKANEQVAQIGTYYDKEVEKVTNGTVKKVEKSVKEVEKKTNGFADVLKNGFGNIAQNTLETLGKSLVEGENSWDNYGATVVEMIAQILEGLAAQLTALAAVNAATYNYGQAAAALAGAGAAMVASGALKALAKSMKTVKESTDGAVQSLSDFRKILSETVSSSQDVGSFVSGYAVLSKEYSKVQKEVTADFNEYFKAQDNYLSMLDKYNKESKAAERGQEDRTNWFLATTTQWNGKKVKLPAETMRALNIAMGEYNQALHKVNESQQKFREAADAMNQIVTQTVVNLESESEAIQTNIDFYKMFYTDAISGSDSYLVALQNQIGILNELNSVYEDLAKAGVEIGQNLVENIIDGATKKDFFSSIRDYLKENIVKLTVYNEEFTRRIAGLGEQMSEAIVRGATEGDALFDVLKDELNDLYDDVSEKTKNIDNMLNQFFEKTEEDSEEWAEETADNLSTFEQNMKSFKDSIKDLGGSLGNEFVNALSNGMNLNDFMDSFKKFIKNMLVQTVVYTDSMKGKIEAIGKKITDALKSGTYSENLFSDMKREISLTFDEAFLQTSIIDDLLNKGLDLNAFATGTNNAERGLALVGEQGAELIDFKGGERVYNARNTADILSGAGGTSNNFNVTFNNVQDTTAFSMMNQLRRYNRELAIAGVF